MSCLDDSLQCYDHVCVCVCVYGGLSFWTHGLFRAIIHPAQLWCGRSGWWWWWCRFYSCCVSLPAAWKSSVWKRRWPVSSYHSYDNLITAVVTWDLLTGQEESEADRSLCLSCCSFITQVPAASDRQSCRWAGLPVSVMRTCCMPWRFTPTAQLAAGQTPAWTRLACR